MFHRIARGMAQSIRFRRFPIAEQVLFSYSRSAMNMPNTVLPTHPMSPDFELNLPAATPMEKPRGKRASNDATTQEPITACDAMALCMKDSAVGG
jgi:hypothetical protein